jgi:hypothetical protein
LRFPFIQFHPSDQGFDVFLRVVPQSGEQRPVYLTSRYDLPPAPEADLVGEVAGRFSLPPGNYRVESLARDDTKRVCRDNWNVEVARGPTQRSTLPSASVGDVTVLLDAAPQDRRSPKLRATDVVTLMSSLSALLGQLHTQSVRLVVFNLDLEMELFRLKAFGVGDIEPLARALNRIQLGVVNYEALQSQSGPAELLAALIRREREEPHRSEIAVFLGPLARSREQVPKGLVASDGVGPKFFYLQYRDPKAPVGSVVPSSAIDADFGSSYRELRSSQVPAPPTEIMDTIAYAMERVKGRTIIALTPQGFASAIFRIAASKPR